MKIYLLQHWYTYGEYDEHDEVKTIGVFSSREKAEETKKKYKNLLGFKDYDEECLYIGERIVDKTEWKEGLIKVE